MSDFTASNGITLRITDDPYLNFGPHQTSPIWLKPEELVALREFFRAEEDERLGRWRWPENPEYVVYPARDGDGVHWSVDERTGESHMNTRAGLQSDEHARAARAYFDAHSEPKPWHNAQEGEIWVLTCDDEILGGAYVAGDYSFVAADHAMPIISERITAGRRIWPEATS